METNSEHLPKMGKRKKRQTREKPWDGLWTLVEVGELFEPIVKNHGGSYLLNQFAYMSLWAAMLMASEQFIHLDDGIHYRRVPQQTDNPSCPVDTRIMFQIRSDVFAQAMERIDEEIRREFFPRNVPEANGKESPDLCRASLFVRQLSSLHDDKGCQDLTPSLSSELDATIQILEKHTDGASWVSETLEVARSLRAKMFSIIITEQCWAPWL